jgi:DNA helicase-2/ATP-dependent DNA helicase PcrA
MVYKLPKNWSAQQQAVIDFGVNSTESCVVEAVAGSGKTTTLMGLIKAVTEAGEVVIYIVFNKKNADEAKEKFADLGIVYPNECCTVHSAGFKALRNTFRNLTVDGSKVYNIIKAKYGFYAHAGIVQQLVSYAKQAAIGVLSPIDDRDAYRELLSHHNVIDEQFQGDDVEVAITRAIEVLIHNNKDTKVIDFDDQIYLCLVHPCKFTQYDVVIIDEAQDTNVCRREIAKRMMKP